MNALCISDNFISSKIWQRLDPWRTKLQHRISHPNTSVAYRLHGAGHTLLMDTLILAFLRVPREEQQPSCDVRYSYCRISFVSQTVLYRLYHVCVYMYIYIHIPIYRMPYNIVYIYIIYIHTIYIYIHIHIELWYCMCLYKGMLYGTSFPIEAFHFPVLPRSAVDARPFAASYRQRWVWRETFYRASDWMVTRKRRKDEKGSYNVVYTTCSIM